MATFHPREGGSKRGGPWRRPMSRREFLRLTGGATLGGAFLLACASREPTGAGGAQVLIGSPDNPVTHPILDDNPPIESGLEPEAGPLKVYNWDEYIWKRVLNEFGEEFGVEVELTTFYNLEEGINKLRTEEVAFDLFFPTSERIPRLVAGGLFQPLNHDYLPNLTNMWPQLADPFYDKGSRYSVPYVVYQTGIGWRADMVDADIASMENPWDVFWDPAHTGITGLYDDYRESLGVGLYRNGINDPNAGAPAQIERAKNSLIELADLVNITYSVDGAYVKLPEGKLGLHHAWSGDLAAAPFYAPKGEDPTTLRYAWPPKTSSAGGFVSNDNMVIPRGAEHPVLAHMFMNYLMDRANSLKNFSWVLYQPPLNEFEPDQIVSDGYILENLTSTIVTEEDFGLGQIPLQLPPEVDAQWLEAWSAVQAGG